MTGGSVYTGFVCEDDGNGNNDYYFNENKDKK